MLRETLKDYKKIVEYGIYFLIILNILDALSTYLGLKYFDAYEANQNTAYLFDVFGILLPLILKVILAIAFSYIVKFLWKKSELLESNQNIWGNYIAKISNLNIIIIVIILNTFYIAIVLNNFNIIWQ